MVTKNRKRLIALVSCSLILFAASWGAARHFSEMKSIHLRVAVDERGGPKESHRTIASDAKRALLLRIGRGGFEPAASTVRAGEYFVVILNSSHRGLIHVRNTKNGKDRIIPMNATVRQLLETQRVLRARKAQENAEKGESKVPSPYVFPSPRTEKRLIEIKYSFTRAVKQAKITDLRFTIFAIPQRPEWVTPAQTLLRWQRSSVGLTFGWRCVTRMRWKMQSAERSKQSQSERLEPHVKMQRLKFHVTGA